MEFFVRVLTLMRTYHTHARFAYQKNGHFWMKLIEWILSSFSKYLHRIECSTLTNCNVKCFLEIYLLCTKWLVKGFQNQIQPLQYKISKEFGSHFCCSFENFIEVDANVEIHFEGEIRDQVYYFDGSDDLDVFK